MSTELAVTRTGQDFSREQIDLLKNTVCKGATDPELKLFIEVCRSKRLDPFSRQIHAVKRPSKNDRGEWTETMTFQTGIDGYRLIAERTGKYAGQDEPMWCGADGLWVQVWLKPEPPIAARAAVYRSDFVKPLVRIARYSAYVQTKKAYGNNPPDPNSMWAKMGPEQLHKCAEALALRAAFPEELAGLYTNEEMGQAENGSREAQQEVAKRKIAEMKAAPPEETLGVSPADALPRFVHEAEFVEVPKSELERQLEASIAAVPDKFKALKHFADLKAKIIEETGSDKLYYRTLGDEGYEKSNQIPQTKTRAVYKALVKAFTDWKGVQPMEEQK